MKYCLITGGNSGIGYQAALQIAQKEYAVTLVCRNAQRAKEACAKIIQQTGGVAGYIVADLSSIGEVNRAAEQYLAANKTLDVLINNAADFDLSMQSAVITTDGLERQFATNVVAPYLLSQRLLPALRGGKIINISSQGLCEYPFLTLDFDNVAGEKSCSPAKAYYKSKLALLMVSLYMRSQQRDVKIQAVRVTNVKIDMSRYEKMHPILKQMYSVKSYFSISPAEMAKVYAALATESGYDGFLYNEKLAEVKCSKSAYDKAAQEKLIRILREITK